MLGAARLVIAVPALAAVAAAAIDASRLGIAGSAGYDAGKEISTWTASGSNPGRETVSWLRAELEQAIAQDHKNPSLHEMLGRLALFTRSDEGTDQAISSFTSALEQRPSSPYSWASLVEALYRKGDTGFRFQESLRRAQETGPWEPPVQRAVADYGLAVWDEVTPSTRSAIERMVANGMVRNAPEILQISLRRGRLGVACAHLGSSMRTDAKWTQLCQSTEAT